MTSLANFLQAGRWRPILAFVILLICLLQFHLSTTLPQSSLRRRALHADNYIEERGFLEAISSAAEKLTGGGKGGGALSTIGELFSGNISGIVSGLAADIAVPAGFLGNGLALGVIAGMMNTSVPTTNATGFNLAAQNLGSGLTKSLVGSIAVAPAGTDMKAAEAAANDTMTMMIGAGTINGAILALAQGLGSGASQALNFTAPSQKAAFNTSGINGAAGNLGQGLTSTFLSGINTTSLFSNTMSGGVSINDLIQGNGTILGSSLSQLAAGAGNGLGQGTAIGLGLQDAATMETSPNGSAGAVQSFTMGLTSSFLQNDTLSKLMTSLMGSGDLSNAMGMGVTEADMTSGSSSSPSFLANMNIAAVAQGFAVGLLDGAGNTLAGMSTPPMQTLMFNDSVGGAATGFGLGLGAQGTILVKQVLANPSIISNLTKSSTAKRHLLQSRAMIPPSSISIIQRRESSSSSGDNSFIDALNATTLDPILQMGIDTIGCAGVGGLFSIGFGILTTGTINTDQLKSVPEMNNDITNNQTFILENGGNTYIINPATMDIQINGIPIERATILIVLHIVFAILTYFILAPTYILVHSTKRVTTLSSLPSPFPAFKSPLFTTFIPALLYILSPILIIFTVILGFVIKGSSSASLSAHGIIGLILLVPTFLTFATSASAIQRKNPGLKTLYKFSFATTMIVAVLVLFSGFVDLTNYTFCAVQALPIVVWIVLGGILLGPMGLAGGVVGMEGLLSRQGGKKGVELRPDMRKGDEKSGSYFDDDDERGRVSGGKV
ncbi:uncharacterized protein EAF02_010905 [Botrytis sinoallii]|uniref:uncharacterized protein n=1 Tax=Botrytis sinoallii TaxID=1463999 RepID=UPI0018FFE5D5|nr:uncharacterized protein EAF02_010905 [Botrytis sinoallii]KAF7859457.1 hypothetical protein EAF02_010905 [Botrytis sinoallii]